MFSILAFGRRIERYASPVDGVNRQCDAEARMSYEPFEPLPLGRTGLRVTRLGLGGASIGGLFEPVSDAAAEAVVEHAWGLGIRHFDVAPLYGYGAAERRMGSVLASQLRDEFVLSTKVGRLVRPLAELRPGDDLDHQAIGGRNDAYYAEVDDRRIVFDYSADGVRRSVEASLERLGLERIDILYIHDPDRHWRAALEGAYPALERLRAEGVVGAIGVGMNQWQMLARFASETDVDVLLVANRYTLLDPGALRTLLPLCLERGIAVLVAGLMNSGVMVDPARGGPFDYGPAPSEIVDRARRIASVCARHDVPVRAAAIQFPLAHPAVTGLIAGVRTAAHLDDYPAGLRRRIPTDLWADLRAEGLLPADAPTPD
jgi:D-threo-aldose 1-dehydrogenase